MKTLPPFLLSTLLLASPCIVLAQTSGGGSSGNSGGFGRAEVKSGASGGFGFGSGTGTANRNPSSLKPPTAVTPLKPQVAQVNPQTGLPAGYGGEGIDIRRDDPNKTLLSTGGSSKRRLVRNMYGTRGETPPLVIPTRKTPSKVILEMQEDLKVMHHLLDKATSQESGREVVMASGIQIKHFGQGNGDLRKWYLGGHGAVLVLDVAYTLMPQDAGTGKDKTKQTTTSAWDQARKEISTSRNPWMGFDPSKVQRQWQGQKPNQYDEKRVESLKARVVETLKEGANMRHLAKDEQVTVIIRSRPSASHYYTTGSGVGAYTVESSGMVTYHMMDGASGKASSTGTLILRASKSDIDAYASGDLSKDEFRDKVMEMIY